MLYEVITGQILNHLDEIGNTADLSSLRFCISAGEALPGSLFRRWQEKFGIEIFDGLGSTEVGYIFICNRPGKVKENSSGLPLPGHTVEVRDETMQPLPPGEIGELWVKSRTVFVITSYSIHYTKLYDIFQSANEFSFHQGSN